MEPDQIDILAFIVLGDLEQIDETQEARLARQLRSDVRKANRRDRVHFDLTLIHAVPGAHFDMGTRPYSNTASDFTATNSLAKSLREHHKREFTNGGGWLCASIAISTYLKLADAGVGSRE